MAIHEFKDNLSQVITRVAATGEEVAITKHGRVVAVLCAPPPDRATLGLGKSAKPSPTLDDFEWSESELNQMFGADLFDDK